MNMRPFHLAALAAVLAAPCTRAAVTYIGDTYIAGAGTDSSKLGSGLLEDGVSPKNGLNGFGSGLAWAGGSTFYALSDRGPNKVSYTGGTAVDNTTSYPCRFQKFEIAADTTGISRVDGLFPSYAISAVHKGTVLFRDPSGTSYTGLSTGYSHASGEPNLRLDPEGLRVASDGSLWVSDEYGPWILHFDSTGLQIDSLHAPEGFHVAVEDSTGDKEAAENKVGRTNNKGAEGLALTPDGKTLVVAMQSALLQDSSTNGLFNRFLVYDLTSLQSAPKQYVYPVDNTSQTISELLAVNNHQFLVDERNSKTGKKGTKYLYLVDIAQATAPTDLAGTEYDGTTALRGLPGKTLPTGIVALQKTLFADIGKILLAATPWPFTAINGTDSLPDKIEGYAFGPDLPDGRHLLLATNDNDYVQPGGAAGTGFPDYFFAFAVDTASLPGFVLPTFGKGAGTTGLASQLGASRLGVEFRGGRLTLSSSVTGNVRLEVLGADGHVEKDIGTVDLVGGHSRGFELALGRGLHILRATGALETTRTFVGI